MAKPKLRFPEFTDEWEEKKLEEIASIYDGTHQTPRYVDKGIPFVSVENIKSLYTTNKYITKEAFEKEFKIYPEKNDILMTRIGDIGTASLITRDMKMAYYVSLALIKPKNHIFADYLVQYISTLDFQKELRKRTLHVAFPKKINKGEIGECKVKVPGYKEQQKIADFLSKVDEKITNQEAVVSGYEEMKKGLMQKIFNKEIRFKADDGREYPEWEKKFIKDCCIYSSSAISAGMVLNNGKYELFDANGKIGYINEFSNKPYISIIKDGAGVGRIRLLPKDTFCIGTMGLLYPVNTIDIQFLYYRLDQFDFRKYVVGGAIPHIYFKDYGLGEVYIPVITEQQKIANFLSTIDKKIEAEKKILEDWKELKKGLLQQMFV